LQEPHKAAVTRLAIYKINKAVLKVSSELFVMLKFQLHVLKCSMKKGPILKKDQCEQIADQQVPICYSVHQSLTNWLDTGTPSCL